MKMFCRACQCAKRSFFASDTRILIKHLTICCTRFCCHQELEKERICVAQVSNNRTLICRFDCFQLFVKAACGESRVFTTLQPLLPPGTIAAKAGHLQQTIVRDLALLYIIERVNTLRLKRDTHKYLRSDMIFGQLQSLSRVSRLLSLLLFSILKK